MEGLEREFDAPVVEAYGMTEAAQQMCCNPLPPAQRKPGSVGLPAGPEVRVVDGDGNTLPAGEVGEVVIRGENVTSGYGRGGDPDAFRGGWFHTGDQGYVDDDGYLFLTGRLKEIINRAGETIAPREIDEALLEHPAVAQAVAFALPDPRLGEDVGAAVVLRSDGDVDERALRRFAAERIADHKVPRRIVFLDELPKGPTGKLQRIGLAERLGLVGETSAADTECGPPATRTEVALATAWCGVLGVRSVDRSAHFFELGGDSVLAARVLAQLESSGFGTLPILLFSRRRLSERWRPRSMNTAKATTRSKRSWTTVDGRARSTSRRLLNPLPRINRLPEHELPPRRKSALRAA